MTLMLQKLGSLELQTLLLPYFKLLDYRLSRLGQHKVCSHLEPLNAYLVSLANREIIHYLLPPSFFKVRHQLSW